MNDFTMYHKEYAPEGRCFNIEGGETQESMARQGWVDDPAKIGVNVWGADAEEMVQKKAAAFERGELPPVDGFHVMTQGQIDAAQRQLDEENARDLALRGDQAQRSESQAQQRAADMRADAARKDEKDPSAQVQVPAGELSPAERKVLVKEALNKVDREHLPNMTASGVVRMEVLDAMLDFDSSQGERDEAQAEIDAEAANAL